MKRKLLTLLCLFTMVACVLFTGCQPGTVSPGPIPPSGKTCVVQFRRDALGAAASVPVSPTVGSFNGGATSISGTLKSATGEWVVLTSDSRETWIPKHAILLIEF